MKPKAHAPAASNHALVESVCLMLCCSAMLASAFLLLADEPLLPSLVQMWAEPEPATAAVKPPPDLESVRNMSRQYIVKWKKYWPPDAAGVLLSEVLGPLNLTRTADGAHPTDRCTAPGTFRLMPSSGRRARDLPSDFAVVLICALQQLDVVGIAQHHQLVSRIVVQRLLKHPGLNVGMDGTSNRTATSEAKSHTRRMLAWTGDSSQITEVFNAKQLWGLGFDGAGVKVAILDTGLDNQHPHFRRVVERSNWTFENTLLDKLGHGTFVAGVVAGTGERCLGFAPNADLHVFKVFTNSQQSYTSWFLDAFNYAIFTDINVLNLSIGGPDYLDQPFVEKINEMVANGIILVSAIGNDGPLFGTLNNPADQTDALGVGGIDFEDRMAGFSSRGMSLWELPSGYGRFKPDVVTYGKNVWGSSMQAGCRALSGTSVASPVATGIVTLLASTHKNEYRRRLVTPASIKQATTETAVRLGDPGIFEQGQGLVNVWNAYNYLKAYKPHASILPPRLNFTDDPYMWPYSRQPFYATMQPVMANLTIVNGMAVTGTVKDARWVAGTNGDSLDIEITHSSSLWPWSGWLALKIVVKASVATPGPAEGKVKLTVESPPDQSDSSGKPQISHIELPIFAKIEPTPPRKQRVLWDQFHSLHYPPAFIPRDLSESKDMLDWNGDHPHTNFRTVFNQLVDAGFYLEVMTTDFTCIDSSQYGTMIIIDSEQDFFDAERDKLARDVKDGGLGLIVVAEWYNVGKMREIRFVDDNTAYTWDALTGGANIPALNRLLAPLGIAWGDSVYRGHFSYGSERAYFGTGVSLTKFPAGGFVLKADGLHVEAGKTEDAAAIAGFAPVGQGRIAALGDSSCLDDSNHRTKCHALMLTLVRATTSGQRNEDVFPEDSKLAAEYISNEPDTPLPPKDKPNMLGMYSILATSRPACSVSAAPLASAAAITESPVAATTQPTAAAQNLESKVSAPTADKKTPPPWTAALDSKLDATPTPSAFGNPKSSWQAMLQRFGGYKRPVIYDSERKAGLVLMGIGLLGLGCLFMAKSRQRPATQGRRRKRPEVSVV